MIERFIEPISDILDKFVVDKDLKIKLQHELKTELYKLNLAQIEVNKEQAKHSFKLKTLSDKLKLPFTSMGMTVDYLEAIEHGATHVRVGSAIFGKRTFQI